VSDFVAAVRSVVLSLRPGDVVTYGEVALEARHPGAARAVGGVMASSEGLPWWRVVTSEGRLVPGHETEQARRLRGEGVEVDGRHVRAFRGTRERRRPLGTMP
jgi:methylated-DNA-protein-cysteine methyltransferase-like protein